MLAVVITNQNESSVNVTNKFAYRNDYIINSQSGVVKMALAYKYNRGYVKYQD